MILALTDKERKGKSMKLKPNVHPSPEAIEWDCAVCQHFSVMPNKEPCKSCYRTASGVRSGWKKKEREKEGKCSDDFR